MGSRLEKVALALHGPGKWTHHVLNPKPIIKGNKKMQTLGGKTMIYDKHKQRADRLEILLTEVNHRIANSLQLVSVLVRQQALAVQDPGVSAKLFSTECQIGAIATVHRLLSTRYDSNIVPLYAYLESIINALSLAFARRDMPRRIVLTGQQIYIPAEHAIYIGMITNELISNACKYAYGESACGEVRVGFRSCSGDLILHVEDDCPGFDLVSKPVGSGLGLQMTVAMAKRLGATFRYDPDHQGARAELIAPDLVCHRDGVAR
jgi:two-component sensor histidine kinase